MIISAAGLKLIIRHLLSTVNTPSVMELRMAMSRAFSVYSSACSLNISSMSRKFIITPTILRLTSLSGVAVIEMVIDLLSTLLILILILASDLPCSKTSAMGDL